MVDKDKNNGCCAEEPKSDNEESQSKEGCC